MSGGLPTERRLAALEQRVLTRIRRRAAIRARVAATVGAAALVVGAFVLVHPSFGSFSTGSSAGGTGAGSASSARAAVRCHATSDAGSPARKVPLPAHPTTASIAAACEGKAAAPGSGASRSSTAGHPLRVVCRSADGVWEVFPDDGHPSTLCSRNGLKTG